MRRAGIVGALGLAAALAGTVVAVAGAKPVSATAGTHPPSPSQIKLAHNKQAAHADAKHMVALVKLPAGAQGSRAQQTRVQPKGGALEGVLTDVVTRAWYVIPESGAKALAYLEQHPPGGVKNDGTMGSGNSSGLQSEALVYDFPNRPGTLFARMMEVSFTLGNSQQTKVEISAQSNWVIPRPSSEKVPAAASQVAISTETENQPKTGAQTGSGSASSPITRRGEVRKLIALADKPPIAQETISAGGCGAPSFPQHQVEVAFENKAGKTVASVTAAWTGTRGYRDACDPSLSFKLGGRTKPELNDPRFLMQLGSITARKLN